MTTHDLGTGGIFFCGRASRRILPLLIVLLFAFGACRTSRDKSESVERGATERDVAVAPLSKALLRDDWAAEVELPAADSRLFSPMRGEVRIIQGNDGAYSHSDDFNRYAWDYAAVVGTPVVAPRAGIVTSRVMHSNIGAPSRSAIADGNHLRLRHDDGTETLFLHLSYDETVPEIGEYCARGEIIGRTGMTGWTDRPHLHFAVMKGGQSLPASFADFDQNDGVPRAGDRHRSANSADYPDDTVDYYKRAYRAAKRARELGLVDAGLVVVDAALATPRDPNYFYHKVLEVYRRRFREAALGDGDDAELRRAVVAAAFAMESNETDQRRIMWAEGRAAWCGREYVRAVDRLAQAARGQPQAFRRGIVRDAQRLANEALRDFENRMNRLADENGRARPEYRATITAEAQRRCEFVTSLVRFIKVEFPELMGWADAAETTRTKYARRLGLSLGARRATEIDPFRSNSKEVLREFLRFRPRESVRVSRCLELSRAAG